MKTNEETVLENVSQSESLNDETRQESLVVDPEVENESGEEANEQENEVSAESAESTDAKRTSWKQVVISGFSGIALGATGALFSGYKIQEPLPDPEPTPGPDLEESILTPGVDSSSGISVATGVDDGMSFNDAFAAARHEVGANGAFVWHGQVYSTCYAEEWNALSPEDQSAFSQNALAAANGQPSPAHNNVATDTDNSLLADNHNQHTDDNNVEVHVLGVEENVVTDDGEVINVGIAQVEGHDALFIDTDADGTFDILAVDSNDDNDIDFANELFDVNDPDMNIGSFNNELATQPDPAVEDIYAQMPDYTNDADVSSLV